MSEKLTRPSLEIIPPHSESLNLPSAEIPVEEIQSIETQQLISELFAIANGTQGDSKKRTMVGLAAPQVGINKRIIVIDVAGTGMGEEPDLRVYVNPVVTPVSSETEPGREGCFSAGNVCGNVQRASEITVEAFDREGNKVKENYSGFTARIFQHETDHLDGVRFPDRITDDKKLHWVEPDQFGDYRNHWQEWDILCSRETWQSIKSGE